jgi:hypothetical protein
VSQRYMSKLIYDVPNAMRTRAQKNLPAAAALWNAEARRVLGVQGSPTNRSRPGQAPRRQTGQLQAGTRAIPAASSLSIQIVTTEVGKYLNGGTKRIAARPFINRITRAVAAAMRVALFKP